MRQRPKQWRKSVAILIACLLFPLVRPAADAVAQSSSGAQPPTIEKVTIETGGSSRFEGAGRSGDVVTIVAGAVPLGETTVGADGRWRVILRAGLQPGTYQIRAEARSGLSTLAAAGDEIRVAVPSQLTGDAIVASDGAGTVVETERATRQRAEILAEGAGKAFDELSGAAKRDRFPRDKSAASDQDETPASPAPPEHVSVVIEWLKRAARAYREEVVAKLAAPTAEPGVPQPKKPDEQISPPNDVKQTAETIAAERAQAEARRIEVAEAAAVRKSAEAEKSAAEAAKKDAAKRKKAEDLARQKAESDQRIAEELERLKKAKEEADRAKARKDVPSSSSSPAQRSSITVERFYLPGEKRPKKDQPAVAALQATSEGQAQSGAVVSSRCSEGQVMHRNGQRWYRTGADDTLWDIAERFYGSGAAYPRIYHVNRKRLSSPHVVRPCLTLRLPGRG
jgi:nucleoid-associated protein YgaU